MSSKKREERTEGKGKGVLTCTILWKLQMKDLSAWVLVISDLSNLVEIDSTKSLKALKVSKKLLEVMPTPNSSTASKCEASTWLNPSLASLITLVVGWSGNSAL